MPSIPCPLSRRAALNGAALSHFKMFTCVPIPYVAHLSLCVVTVNDVDRNEAPLHYPVVGRFETLRFETWMRPTIDSLNAL
jgi:hypothetical protein